jgi:hypothetical protein
MNAEDDRSGQPSVVSETSQRVEKPALVRVIRRRSLDTKASCGIGLRLTMKRELAAIRACHCEPLLLHLGTGAASSRTN